jgi:DNA-binding response OmpR family regulator
LEILKDINILYVEDEPNIHSEVIYILKEYTNNIYTAYDGKKGLDKFLELKDKNINIDILITDINLPVMNGVEMIKELRQIDNSFDIIVITAKSKSYIQSKLGDIAINNTLYKPFDPIKLLKLMKGISARRQMAKED